jgi:predicted lipoprotein with Yx(FWY)xxD motif
MRLQHRRRDCAGESLRRWLLLASFPAMLVLASCDPGQPGSDSATVNTSATGARPEFLKYWQAPDSTDQEAWIPEPLPPGFQVMIAPLEGPVFADSRGRTLYSWPLQDQRNGQAGDREGLPSSCTDDILTVSAGLMSPYPPGLELPDLDRRKSCTAVWPPVLAPEGAEPVGSWSIINRIDGSGQWAYDGQPLYTSILDQRPGDAWGGTKMDTSGDAGVPRDPVGPQPLIPPAFNVVQSSTGRLVVNISGYSVYSRDGDEPGKSNCHDACLEDWTPVPAPENVTERGGWSTFERSPGINQWAFRGKPLYTYNYDREERSFTGADVPGWHNVYTQRAPFPPEEFTVQDAEFGGQVLADSRGRTIYLYNCIEDTFAQLSCNDPGTTQAYRLAICGNGDPELCRETFPYVPAPAGASAASSLWTVMTIDPNSGHIAAPGQDGAMNVWAYRGRPVYTYAGDEYPGAVNGHGIGEFSGTRNGYHAFALRDIFMDYEFRRP